MKRISFVILVSIFFLFIISGCDPTVSDELKKDDIMGSQPEAKVGDGAKTDSGLPDNDDQWDIRKLSVKEEWNDLKIEILGIALGKGIGDGEEVKDAISLKFRIENTRPDGGGELTTYPDQATLITSTGEQLNPSMWHSDSIGGAIYEGVIKDGSVIWFLERANVDKVEWIRIKFTADDYNLDWDHNFYGKEFDIRIDID